MNHELLKNNSFENIVIIMVKLNDAEELNLNCICLSRKKE